MNEDDSFELDQPQVVFVVDDEPLSLELVSLTLEPLGYGVRTFQNPAHALHAFSDSNPSPSLLITDYSMPRMTGVDLIRECRRINPGQKAILISGTVNGDVSADSIAQPDGFLAKPFPFNKLASLVKKILSRK